MALSLPHWTSAEQVERALSAYDLLGPTEWVLHHVSENVTCRVTTPDENYALRLYRPAKWTREQILEEHRALVLSSAFGPPVPCLVKDRATLLPDPVAALFPWVQGAPPVLLSTGFFHELGQLAAGLHQAMAPMAEGSCRPGLGPETLVEASIARLKRPWSEDLLDSGLLVQLETAGALASERWRELAPATAYLHGDLHSAHVLTGPAGLIPLDFDSCGVGPVAYELATAFAEARRRPDADGLMSELLAGYGAAAPEANEIRLFTWVRELAVASWVAGLTPFPFPEPRGAFLVQVVRELLKTIDQVTEVSLTV